jgi:hypothetical protein
MIHTTRAVRRAAVNRMIPKLTLRYRQSRTPLIPKDIETDRAVGIDVGVVDLGCEGHLWGFEWVVWESAQDGRRTWREELDIPVGKVRELLGQHSVRIKLVKRRTGRRHRQSMVSHSTSYQLSLRDVSELVAYRPHDRRLPLEQVVSDRSRRA